LFAWNDFPQDIACLSVDIFNAVHDIFSCYLVEACFLARRSCDGNPQGVALAGVDDN